MFLKYLLKHQITITTENLPSTLDVEKISSIEQQKPIKKWKRLSASLAKEGNPQSRFVWSRLSHELHQYFAWKHDSFAQGKESLQQIWCNQFLFAFAQFCLVIKVLRKLSSAQTGKMLLVTPTWQSQTLHQLLLKISIVFPYNLSKIYLSHMLVILMTLTSASRDSQMYCLDVKLMLKLEVPSIFALHKLHKTLRKDKASPKFCFYKYLKDQELCVASASNKYRKRRKTWSKNWGKFKLPLSYIKPMWKSIVELSLDQWKGYWKKLVLVLMFLNVTLHVQHLPQKQVYQKFQWMI